VGDGRTIRVGRKCHELREQHKSWAEIAEILSSLGPDYLKETSEAYTAGGLSSLYSNNKREILASYEQDERTEEVRGDQLTTKVEELVQELLDQRLPKMEDDLASQVRKMVQEEISRQFVSGTSSRSESAHEMDELPPEPKDKKVVGAKGKGRSKQDRKYVRKTLTVDVNLWKLFEQDMKARRISSAGRMVDAILWTHYRRPTLSYMTESEEPQKDNGESSKPPSGEE
jgi:hypothetical protein